MSERSRHHSRDARHRLEENHAVQVFAATNKPERGGRRCEQSVTRTESTRRESRFGELNSSTHFAKSAWAGGGDALSRCPVFDVISMSAFILSSENGVFLARPLQPL